MHQYRILLIPTAILFLVVNTSYFWRGVLGGWGFLLMMFCIVVFLILLACLIRQLFLLVKERFKTNARIYSTISMIALLGMIAAKPTGVINFDVLERNDLFIAGQKGAASCTTIIKLKEDKQFYIQSICFGEEKDWGTYAIKGDTIKLKFAHLNDRQWHYEFGIYKADANPSGKVHGELKLYKSAKDTLPYPLVVYKNDLIK